MEPKRPSTKPAIIGMVVVLALIVAIVAFARHNEGLEENSADPQAYPFPTVSTDIQTFVAPEVSRQYKQDIDEAENCTNLYSVMSRVMLVQADENREFDGWMDSHQGSWLPEDQKRLDAHGHLNSYIQGVLMYAKPHQVQMKCPVFTD